MLVSTDHRRQLLSALVVGICTLKTYDEKAGLEKAWIERLVGFTRQSQNLTHMIDPEMARGIVHVTDVAE